MRGVLAALALPCAGLALAGCAYADDDARGVSRGETLLSVSASGEADSTPDTARFTAGVQSFSTSARAASDANAEAVRDVIAALRASGVADADIQTQAVTVRRIEYGDREGQYEAGNRVAVRVRDVSKAGEAVTAATEAGANVLDGPTLSMDDAEASINSAYANAYKAARARAEAYAAAAGMEVRRVLYIRDAGGYQGNRYIAGAQAMDMAIGEERPAAPPPPVNTAIPRPDSGAPFMAGTTTSGVSVQVDFALEPR